MFLSFSAFDTINDLEKGVEYELDLEHEEMEASEKIWCVFVFRPHARELLSVRP